MCSYEIYIALRCPKLHDNDLGLSGIGGNQITPIGFINVVKVFSVLPIVLIIESNGKCLDYFSAVCL